MATEFRRMMQLRGDAATWGANDQILLSGEIAFQIEAGVWRMKVGDGAALYSALPFIGETDPTARADIVTLQGDVTDLDTRLLVVEASTGSISTLEGRVDAVEAALPGKQAAIADGTNEGDLIVWNGSAWEPSEITLGLGSMLYWNPGLNNYIGIPIGDEGQSLVVAGGTPAWGFPTTARNRVIALTGGASVQAAFNTLAPTINNGDVVTVTWEDRSYHYVGPSGAAISTSTSGDFTLLGYTDPVIAFEVQTTVDTFTVATGGVDKGQLILSPDIGKMEMVTNDLTITDITNTTWTITGTPSDPRMKEDARVLTLDEKSDILDTIVNLDLFSYKFRKEHGGQHISAGVMTDMLAKIAPELVVRGGTFEQVNLLNLVSRLIAAIQVLAHRVEELEDEV